MPSENLFVSNLYPTVTDEILETYFAPYGEILSLKVMLDVHTGKSRGYGFVMYSHQEDAENAMKALNHVKVNGAAMIIQRANTSGESALVKTTKMYIRNVPKSIPKEEILTMLNSFGTVVRHNFRKDDLVSNDASQRYLQDLVEVLFAEYSVAEETDLAVRKLHNTKPWPNMVVPLLAKQAETVHMRNERQKRIGNNKKTKDVTESPISKQAEATPPPYTIVSTMQSIPSLFGSGTTASYTPIARGAAPSLPLQYMLPSTALPLSAPPYVPSHHMALPTTLSCGLSNVFYPHGMQGPVYVLAPMEPQHMFFQHAK